MNHYLGMSLSSYCSDKLAVAISDRVLDQFHGICFWCVMLIQVAEAVARGKGEIPQLNCYPKSCFPE